MTDATILPRREEEDWTDEELRLAARPNGHSDGDGVWATYGIAEDGSEWGLSHNTKKVNDSREVAVSPPWAEAFIEPTPTQPMACRYPRKLPSQTYSVPGPEDRPLVLVLRNVTCGAGTVGRRFVYAGPYVGSPRDIFPISGVFDSE